MTELLFTDSIVIVRAGSTTGRYGDTVPDWSTATRTTIDGVNVQPTSQNAETTDGTRDSTTTTWVGFTAMDSGDLDITATDRIEYAGLTLEVYGTPRRWPNPLTGGVSKVEWTMREVLG